jgi:hypothetical protein
VDVTVLRREAMTMTMAMAVAIAHGYENVMQVHREAVANVLGAALSKKNHQLRCRQDLRDVAICPRPWQPCLLLFCVRAPAGADCIRPWEQVFAPFLYAVTLRPLLPPVSLGAAPSLDVHEAALH